MAKNIPLTKMIFAGLVVTFLFGTLFGVYAEFIALNGGEIQEPYRTAFENIASQYSGFEGLSNNAADQGLVKNILDFGKGAITGTVNVFVIGLDAIGSFFSIIPIIGNIVSAVSQAVPGFQGLLGLLTVIITLYVSMRYIQTLTNKPDLP